MIGNNIRLLREKKSYSQEALAKILHMRASIINLWENGNGIPNVGEVLLLSKVFEVSTDDILLGDTVVLHIGHLSEDHKELVREIYNSFLKLNQESCE